MTATSASRGTADRYSRRTVLLVGDALRFLAMIVLAVVVAMKGPVELVIALTALASAAGTAERPAAMALLPRLVGEVRLGPANALLHTAQDPVFAIVSIEISRNNPGRRSEGTVTA